MVVLIAAANSLPRLIGNGLRLTSVTTDGFRVQFFGSHTPREPGRFFPV